MKTLFIVCMMAAPFAASAQTSPPTCATATLTGTRSLVLTGRDVSASAVLSKVTQSVGTATFDGIGKVSFSLISNTNLSLGVSQTWTGTYALPANCVGTISITSGDAATFTLIPFNNGKNFTITGQDGTYALTGSGSTPPSVCAAASLSGAYLFSGNGFGLSSGSVSGVNAISGLLQFDGRSAVTGNWSVALNGSAASVSVSGQYSVTSGCAASATVTDSSGVSYSMAFIVTSADAAGFTVDIGTLAAVFSAAGHSAFTNPGLALASAANGLSAATPPGSIFALYGSNLATANSQPNNVPLPTTVLTTTATVNGEAVPLFYVSPSQVNAQMPLDIQPGLATVVVSVGSTMSNSAAFIVPATAVPGIFLYGNNRAVVQNHDLSLNSPTSPAKVGEVVVAYLTGGGPVNAAGPWNTGHASPNGSSPVTESVGITVGGQTAVVNYVGLTPTLVGLYQANFVIPQIAAGDRNLVISVGGTASAPALISVSN